jgi:AbrB family looped-hinge helix DNA binding protein
MALATMTSKGQTTIPKSVRESAGLHPGDSIHFTVLPDRTIIMRAKTRSIFDLATKPKKRRHVSIEQMNR